MLTRFSNQMGGVGAGVWREPEQTKLLDLSGNQGSVTFGIILESSQPSNTTCSSKTKRYIFWIYSPLIHLSSVFEALGSDWSSLMDP